MVFAIKNELGRMLDDAGNEISSPAAGDKIPVFDVSNKVVGYVTASNLAAIQEATEVATTLIARQDGGVAGTDEVQITHDGATGAIESKSGTLDFIAQGSGNPVVSVGTGGLRVRQNGGTFNTDDLILYHNGTDAFLNALSGSIDFKLATTNKLEVNSSEVNIVDALAIGGVTVTATPAELNKNDISAQAETIDSGAAASVTIKNTKIDNTVGGAGAITLAAPDASMYGVVKTIEMIVDGGDVTLSLTNVQGGSAATTATFADVNDALILIGGTSKWHVIGESGVALS